MTTPEPPATVVPEAPVSGSPENRDTAPEAIHTINIAPLISEPTQRLTSLDVFRGITLTFMLIANNPGNGRYTFVQMEHADWNGCTFTDLIFPSFVFIMGVALTFSFAKRIELGASRKKMLLQVVRRTILLFGFGLLLAALSYWLLHTPGSPKKLRYLGVLQRIALCYFFASCISLAGIKARGQAIIALALLIGYHLLMKHVPVPGYGAGVLKEPGNLASYLDAKILGAHSYHYISEMNTWHDPEGILSTIPAIATALIGTMTGFWLRDRSRGGYEKAAGMMMVGLFLMVAGWLWSYLFPFNKNLWSPSYVLYAGGWALGGLGTCLFLTDMKRIMWWTKPFLIMGTNSIAIYVTVGIVSILSVTRFPLSGADHTFRAKDWAYDHLVANWAVPLFGNSTSSLLYGILYIAVFTLIFSWFYKRRIFFRV